MPTSRVRLLTSTSRQQHQAQHCNIVTPAEGRYYFFRLHPFFQVHIGTLGVPNLQRRIDIRLRVSDTDILILLHLHVPAPSNVSP